MSDAAYLVEFLVSFIVSTVTVWICSKSVETEKANFRTAAIVVGLATVLVLVAVGVSVLIGLAVSFFGTGVPWVPSTGIPLFWVLFCTVIVLSRLVLASHARV